MSIPRQREGWPRGTPVSSVEPLLRWEVLATGSSSPFYLLLVGCLVHPESGNFQPMGALRRVRAWSLGCGAAAQVGSVGFSTNGRTPLVRAGLQLRL